MTEYRNYAEFMNASEEVLWWVDNVLNAYLKNRKPNVSTVEHIIDFLVSDKAPKRLRKMSFKQAKESAEKWNKSLQKKGKNIKEADDDVELVLDFKDGFKVVKLIGKKAYEKEGAMMRHCVSSYYGKDDEIYSLRDDKNEPHCTMSKSSQQIKGKGNGEIHPKYIDYVVKFLEFMNIPVRDSEMENLGYRNLSFIKDLIKNDLYRGKYLRANEEIIFKNKKYRIINEDINTLEKYNNLDKYDIVFGNIDLVGTNITEFKQTAPIGGSVYLEGTKITEFKQTHPIGGKIYLDKGVKFINDFQQKKGVKL